MILLLFSLLGYSVALLLLRLLFYPAALKARQAAALQLFASARQGLNLEQRLMRLFENRLPMALDRLKAEMPLVAMVSDDLEDVILKEAHKEIGSIEGVITAKWKGVEERVTLKIKRLLQQEIAVLAILGAAVGLFMATLIGGALS